MGMKNTEATQTTADREILKVNGHPHGPRFGFGPQSVDCHNYDEHRERFFRIGAKWHCPVCDDER